MVLLNKATLSSFSFHAPIALLFFQCFVCVVLVQICSILGFIKLEPWYALCTSVLEGALLLTLIVFYGYRSRIPLYPLPHDGIGTAHCRTEHSPVGRWLFQPQCSWQAQMSWS